MLNYKFLHNLQAVAQVKKFFMHYCLPYAVKEAIERGSDRKEKKKKEQELCQSISEYRDLINGMKESVWIFGLDGKLIDVNDTALQQLGYSRDELHKIRLADIDKHISQEELYSMAEKFPSIKTRCFPTFHTTRSGKRIPVEITSTLASYRGDKVIVSVARDISERIRVEHQLKLLSRSVEEIPVSIIITNSRGNIEYINPAFARITGYRFEELKGSTPRIFKSGKQHSSFYQKLWDTILTGKVWNGEMINKKKNGELFLEKISISPILNKHGNITHFVSVREDITEKKKMIEDLVAAKEKAEESDRLKSAFLANMSHEIRTPMNGILGFTELLKEPHLKGKEKNKYIKIIQKSGERMLNTINDLIEISKIESGSMEVHLSEVDINSQIDYFENFFKPEARNKGLEIFTTKQLSADQAILKTDKEKLSGIFMNLIKNAVKYTHEGKIEFGYQVKGNRFEFFVKDTGIGIAKENQAIIFDRFIQADMSLSKPYEGAGLGLSITKAYTEILGGNIRVESEPGKGSVFFFDLPYRETSMAVETAQIPGSESEGTDILKYLKIMVVEDDPIGLVYLKEIFKGRCRELFYASNGLEAVELYHDNQDIDVILMDIRIPGIDGYEATKRIKEMSKNVLIIAQTAYAIAGDREKVIAAGCDAYVPKPFNKNDLTGLIEQYFARESAYKIHVK